MDAHPVPDIDVMTMELWSLPMAASWLIWRTEDAVRRACPDANGYTSRPDLFELFAQACDPDLLPLMGGAKAQIEFWAPMGDGRIKSAGVPRHASVRVLIPANEWRGFTHIRVQNRHPEAIGTLDEIHYKDVVVPRAQAMAVWPELTEQPDDVSIENASKSDEHDTPTQSDKFVRSSPLTASSGVENAGHLQEFKTQADGPKSGPIPATQQEILAIADGLWPDGKYPLRKNERNNQIGEDWKRKGKGPIPSDRTFRRAFNKRPKSAK